MSAIPYILYLLLIAMHVVILRDVTTIFGAAINLPALIVLMVALYKEDTPAIWFGFLAGMVASAGLPFRMGWHALVMAAVALAASQVKIRLNLDSLKAKLLLVAGGVFVHNVAVLVIDQGMGVFSPLILSAVTGAIYTSVIAWLFFLLKEGIVTTQKIKSIF